MNGTNDLSRCPVTLIEDSTLIAVVEMSQSAGSSPAWCPVSDVGR